MIINKYGISLSRLTEKDVELVRQMRNSREISSKMFFQKKITEDQQQKWFSSINNAYHYYFLIEYKTKKIGLIHGKVLSYEDKIAEGGMFIWEKNYLNSHLPVISSICLADITFLIMGMEITYADVRKDNQTAIDYNLKLGYTVVENIEKEGRLKMQLSKEQYFKCARPIREMIKKITNDYEDISWNDVHLSIEDKKVLYEELPTYLKKVINNKLGKNV